VSSQLHAPRLAVLVGRFQPFQQAHLATLRQALALAPRVLVVIGSAHQARSPRHPFSWPERAEMILAALPPAERARVQCLPLRDQHDDARWLQALQAGVAALAPGVAAGDITLLGCFDDAALGGLRGVRGWQRLDVPQCPGADGSALRDAYFAAADDALPATLAALAAELPASSLAFLRAWATGPERAAVAEEWRVLRRYQAAWADAPYPPVFVTVDAVVRCSGHVLLIQRGAAPGRGLHAVPGGFIEPRETVYQSALRELAEETHLALPADRWRQALRATAVFDQPDRSQRGRTLTHAHFFDLGECALPPLQADDDAQAAAWVPVAALPAMEAMFFDDHFQMLDHFLGLTGAPGWP